MQASNSTNDEDYSVVVMVENSGFRDKKSPSEFPHSIAWKVSKNYLTEDTAGYTRSKKFNLSSTTHKYDLIIQSLQSRDMISDMLRKIGIPFPLNKLRWKTRSEEMKALPTSVDKNGVRWKTGSSFVEIELTSVDDMITNVQRAVEKMIGEGGRRNKQVDVIVRVEQEIRIPQGQYNAMVARRELEGMINGFYSMLSCTASFENIATRGIVVSSWNKIRSFAAAAGFNVNNINNANIDSRGNDNLLNINALLMDLGMLVESMSIDHQALKPKPANRASVEALKTFDKEEDAYGTSTSSDHYCVVCLEKMLSGEEVTCLPKPCSHMFHANCIVQWLKFAHTCPVCRFALPTD